MMGNRIIAFLAILAAGLLLGVGFDRILLRSRFSNSGNSEQMAAPIGEAPKSQISSPDSETAAAISLDDLESALHQLAAGKSSSREYSQLQKLVQAIQPTDFASA